MAGDRTKSLECMQSKGNNSYICFYNFHEITSIAYTVMAEGGQNH